METIHQQLIKEIENFLYFFQKGVDISFYI